MEKCALLFHFEEQRAQKLKKAFSRLEIAVKQVKPEEYGLPLGLLAGLPGSFLFAGRDGAGGPQSAGAAGPKETEPDQEHRGVCRPRRSCRSALRRCGRCNSCFSPTSCTSADSGSSTPNCLRGNFAAYRPDHNSRRMRSSRSSLPKSGGPSRSRRMYRSACF